MENQLIKIESELDLAQIVMRAVYSNCNKNKPASKDEIIESVMSQYHSDAPTIEKMIQLLHKHYALLEEHISMENDNNSKNKVMKVGWSLIFDTR